MHSVPFRILPLFAALLALLALSAGASEIEVISRVPYAAGASQPGGVSADDRGAFSADGRYAVISTRATAVLPGLLDLNGAFDVFLIDRAAGTTRLISAAARSPRATAGGESSEARLSADGRFVLFTSSAADLVEPPTTGRQVFRYEVATGQIRLISHRFGQPAQAVSGDGRGHAISADGRYVVFESDAPADQLVPGIADVNTFRDLFLWDALDGAVELITRKVDLPGETPGSVPYLVDVYVADGGKTALIGPQRLGFPEPGGFLHTFVFDPATTANTLASHGSASTAVPADTRTSRLCDLSADGRYVVFTSSATDHVAGQLDDNGADDLFLFDGDDLSLQLISHLPGNPARTGNGQTHCGTLSEDGRYLHYATRAGDLVAGASDTNGSWDLLRYDRATGESRLVTARATHPHVAGGGVDLDSGSLPHAGGQVLFASSAGDLVSGPLSGSGPWSYLWNNGTQQLSLALGPPGDPAASWPSRPAALSGDGAAAFFHSSYLPQLLPGVPPPAGGFAHLLLADRETGAKRLAVPAAFAGYGSSSQATHVASSRPLAHPSALISEDGTRVAFLTGSNEICGSGTPLCLLDRTSGAMRGVRHRWNDPGAPVAGEIYPLAISQDGGQLLLQSLAAEHAPGDGNGDWDLFLYDTAARSYELISRRFGSAAIAGDRKSDQDRDGLPRMMTPDARRIVFASLATDLAAIPTTTWNVYLADRESGELRLLSHRPGEPLREGDSASLKPQISADGNHVLFFSHARDLVPGFVDGGGSQPDLFLHDLATGVTSLVSHLAGSPASAGSLTGRAAWLSADGRYVVHANRHPGMASPVTDLNDSDDVYRYDRATGTNVLISHVGGDPFTASNGSCAPQGLSNDGRFVLLQCLGDDLVPGVAGRQLYLWDGVDGSLRLVSHPQGAPGIGLGEGLGAARLAGDGSRVFFFTSSTAVIPGLADTAGSYDLFAWSRSGGALDLLTRRRDSGSVAAGDALCDFDYGFAPASATGDRVLFYCRGSALVPHDNNSLFDLFLASLPSPLFADGFESGSTGAWSP